jgi:hypothetical protein
VLPVVVELVGVAAAGKSTLLRTLSERDPRLRAGVRPPTHRHVPSAIAMLPTFLALHRPYHAVLWNEMKRIAYLRTLRSLLPEQRRPVVVLDEGAVYMLARLLVFGDERIRTAAFARWWSAAIANWASVLRVLVWLDAPDSVLIERLRTRRQVHPVKALPDDEVIRFLGLYRAAYTCVLGELVACGGPRAVTLRSDLESVDALADRVAAEIRESERTRS